MSAVRTWLPWHLTDLQIPGASRATQVTAGLRGGNDQISDIPSRAAFT